MVCMYVVDTPSVLYSVDLHFPNIGRNQADTPFDLIIWRRLTDDGDSLNYRRKNLTIDPITTFNEFQTVRIPELFISDTVYIGWEQHTNEMMVVGLDKENDTGDKLFYNVDGTWTMPKWAVERWTRQMNTEYKNLSEEEKDSDRREADGMLNIINK